MWQRTAPRRVDRQRRAHPSVRARSSPAFIGDSCSVRRDAVVTRGSSLEHHTEIDCATVIDNSNVMPFTRIGAGLDMEYSVVGFRQVHSLSRELTVSIEDPHLIGATTTDLSAYLIAGLSWLLNLLPAIGWKLIVGSRTETILGAPTEAMSQISAMPDALAPVESQTKSYREMAAGRRYGNE